MGMAPQHSICRAPKTAIWQLLRAITVAPSTGPGPGPSWDADGANAGHGRCAPRPGDLEPAAGGGTDPSGGQGGTRAVLIPGAGPAPIPVGTLARPNTAVVIHRVAGGSGSAGPPTGGAGASRTRPAPASCPRPRAAAAAATAAGLSESGQAARPRALFLGVRRGQAGGPHHAEQGQDHVAVPAPGIAHLVLVQAHLLLGQLKGRLDTPAAVGHPDQGGQVAGLGPHTR